MLAWIIYLFGCLSLLFASFTFLSHKTSNKTIILSQNGLQSRWTVITAYFAILLLEIPRRLITNFLLSQHVWQAWMKENGSDSIRSIKIKANSIKLSKSKQKEFHSCVSNNVVITNEKTTKKYTEMDSSLETMISLYSTLIGRLQIIALAKISFPLPMLGAVHVSNEFDLLDDLDEASFFDIEVIVHNFQKHRRGVLFEVSSTISQGGRDVWKCKTQFLSNVQYKNPNVATHSFPMREFSANVQSAIDSKSNIHQVELKLDGNLGKRFAAICLDYNLIHISPLFARLFGFKQCIAHGICAYAKALVFMPKENSPTIPFKSTVYFISPLFIPSVAKVQIASSIETNENINITFISITSKRCNVVGTIHCTFKPK